MLQRALTIACMVFVVLWLHGARADTSVQDWVRPQADIARSATDAAGNTYVVGTDVAKYDASGTEVWRHTFNPCGAPCGSEYVNAVTLGSSASFFWIVGAAGVSYDGDDIFVVQYDSSGNLLWAKTYGGAANENDPARAVVADAANNVYVTGSVKNGTNPDVVTLKYDFSGNLLWARTYDGGGNDYGMDVAIDVAGRVYVAATVVTNNAEDYGLIMYDSNGNQQCTDDFNGGYAGQNDIPVGIVALPGGGAFLTGGSRGPSNNDVVTIKYNTGCGRDGFFRYDPGTNDGASGIALDGVGGFYIVGWTENDIAPPYNNGVLTQHYDGSGNVLWSRRYDGAQNPFDSWPSRLTVRPSGVYVTGWLPTAGGGDWKTVAYAHDTGAQRWVQSYSSAGADDDYPRSIGSDSAGNVYVAGYQTESLTGALVKYAADTDGDGCPDAKELGPDHTLGGQRDPNNPYDWYDVPYPALRDHPPIGARDRGIGVTTDVVALLRYVGLTSADIDYMVDYDGNGVADGLQYDRSLSTTPGQPWRSGPPDGGIGITTDGVAMLAQAGNTCT